MHKVFILFFSFLLVFSCCSFVVHFSDRVTS
nr:MAG TPA: hypothetical protein [Caudoviricetes sp.]